MSDIKTLRMVPREIKAVQFTGDNAEWLKNWIQDKLAFQVVTVTAERLYLPSVGGAEILEVGDWVFYDPTDNFFRGATDDAVVRFYEEVEVGGDPHANEPAGTGEA